MWSRMLFSGLVSLSLLGGVASAQQPAPANQDERTRGWLESRDKPVTTARPVPAPVKPVTPTKTEPRAKQPANTKSVPKKPGVDSVPAPELVNDDTLGLGYTLFLINKSNALERVSPERQFKSGDRLCLLVEANRDGYIYIFTQENNDAPKLLYPSTQVRNGNNFVRAHQTFWLPEEGEIELDERPATEKLTVVFSEKPLSNLAVSNKPEGTPVEFKLFQDVAQATPVRKAGQLDAGSLLSQTEGQRGVRLKGKDPAPAVILLNQNPTESRIVTTIQLTHH